MFKFILLSSFFILFLSGCGQNLGNRVEGEKITIYFEDKNDLELAKKIGKFWKENELIGSKKQTLKLEREGKNYALFLVASFPNEIATIPFEHQKLLYELQNQLDSLVPAGKKMQLVLSNSKFEELKRISF